MKPLYFPYTFVTRKTALEISAFFQVFAVYQPSSDMLPAEMQALVDSGLLEVQVPDASEAGRFKSVVGDFQQWGNQQRSGQEIQAAALRSRKDPVPFFDESSATQIVAGIRQQLAASPENDAADSTFEARVFLAFAQELDRLYQEINGEIGAYADKVQDLYADINIERDNPLKEPFAGLEIRPSDPAEFMLPRRLGAWEKLHRKDPADPQILLTTSPLILDHLSEHISSVERMHQLTCASVGLQKDETREKWQQNLLLYLSKLAKTRWPAELDFPSHAIEAESSRDRFSLSVYIIPDLTPRDCLARSIPASRRPAGEHIPRSAIRNTVIGLIEE